MKKKILIGAVIVVAIVGVICLAVFKTEPPINADTIHDASEETGFIGEKIIGNPDEARLTIYEYADFGCSHCAEWNRKINELISKYGEQIALVYRSYDIGQFKNSPVAARAATAAQIQGYFKEYKDLLFANQTEWYYEDSKELNETLVEYLKEASNNSGDIDKFKSDMKSDAVKKRLKFEQRLGKAINLAGTPTFRIDGETISISELVETIEKKVSR